MGSDTEQGQYWIWIILCRYSLHGRPEWELRTLLSCWYITYGGSIGFLTSKCIIGNTFQMAHFILIGSNLMTVTKRDTKNVYTSCNLTIQLDLGRNFKHANYVRTSSVITNKGFLSEFTHWICMNTFMNTTRTHEQIDFDTAIPHNEEITAN